MSSSSSQLESLEKIKSVIEIVPCNTGLDNGVLELNAANAVRFVVKEEILNLCFEGQYTDLIRDGSFCLQRNLCDLITPEDKVKLKKLYPGSDYDLFGNILEVTFIGSSQDNNFDFKFGTPLTRMSMMMTKFLVENLTSNYEKYLADDTQRLAAVAIPKMEPGSFIAQTYDHKDASDNYFTMARAIPIIQTDSSLYLSTVRMYGGLQINWLSNTMTSLASQKDKCVIRRDSLLGFVVANLPAAKLVYDTSKYGAQFPENTDTFLVVPKRVIDHVISHIEHHAKIVHKNTAVCIAKTPFFLECIEMQHDFYYDPPKERFISKRNLVHVIDATKKFKIVVCVKLRIQYPEFTKKSTAMDINDAHLWYRDIWRLSDVNHKTCAVNKDAKPFDCTIAAQVRQRKKEMVDEQRKKTTITKRNRTEDPEEKIDNDAIDDDDETNKVIERYEYNIPTCSSSSQLADD